MKVTYGPQAVGELRKIVKSYEHSQTGLGALVLEALDRQMQAFAESPLRGTVIDETHRRLRMKYFPLTILCRVLPDEVQVVAVALEHQGPDDVESDTRPDDRIEEATTRYASSA